MGKIIPTPAWPEGTSEVLMCLWNEGLSTGEIARRLGLTSSAITSRVLRLRDQGVPLASRKTNEGFTLGEAAKPTPAPVSTVRRRRLYCGETFKSLHIGNRICPACSKQNAFVSGAA